MRFINELIKRLEAAASERERAAQEAYLADATDIYDVEARLREWDRLHSNARNDFPALDGLKLH